MGIQFVVAILLFLFVGMWLDGSSEPPLAPDPRRVRRAAAFYGRDVP